MADDDSQNSFSDFLNTIQDYENGDHDDDDEEEDDSFEEDDGEEDDEEEDSYEGDGTEMGDEEEEGEESEDEFEEDDTEYDEGDGEEDENEEDEGDEEHDDEEENDEEEGEYEEDDDAEEYEDATPNKDFNDEESGVDEDDLEEDDDDEDDDENEEEDENEDEEDEEDQEDEDEDDEEGEEEDSAVDTGEDEDEGDYEQESGSVGNFVSTDDSDDFRDEQQSDDEDEDNYNHNDRDDDDDDDEDSDEDAQDDSDEDENDDNEDSSKQGFDDDEDELNSFLPGADGDSDSEHDDFADEFDPWAKPSTETPSDNAPPPRRNRTSLSQFGGGGRRGGLGSRVSMPSLGKVSVPKGRSSRLFLIVVTSVLCIGVLVLILYFAGVGPFGEEDPTKAPKPSPPTPVPTISMSPSSQPTLEPELVETTVNPNYQVIVPLGMANNITEESVSRDLIALMDLLAPDVLDTFTAGGERRMLRTGWRKLESYSIKLPTSIDEISPIECPSLAPADSLCVDVLANVVLVYENNTISVDDYREALETALDSGELEEKSDKIDSETEIIVFGVGQPPSLPPSSSNQTTSSPVQSTSPAGVGSTMPSLQPTTASPLGNAPSVSPSKSLADVVPSASPSTTSTGVRPTATTPSPIIATAPPKETPLRFFVIAGDSNVVGSADLNHLVMLSLSDTSFSRFVTSSFSPVERDDAIVVFANEYATTAVSLEGKLSTQFGMNGSRFGPEVGMGFDLADDFEDNIVILKCGGTGGAMAEEWLPPSSGVPGTYYSRLVDDIKAAMLRVEELGGASGQAAEFAGMVWFQGYDDAFNNVFRSAYETNLRNFITDIRIEFNLPNLPIVIAEAGAQGSTPNTEEQEMREIQKRVVDSYDNTILTVTSQFITGFDTSSATEVFGTLSNYWGRADVMLNIGYQFAADMLELRRGGGMSRQ